MTKAERDLLLAVAHAMKIGNPTIKDLVDKVAAKAEPEPDPVPEPEHKTKHTSQHR